MPLYFLAHGAIFEGGENQLVVAPDEFVRPALVLTATAVKGEQAVIVVVGRVFLLARLVHLLNGLEWQNNIADFIRLAVPDKLHLALVLKEQETVLVRQRLVFFHVADNFLFFLLRKFWHGTPRMTEWTICVLGVHQVCLWF